MTVYVDEPTRFPEKDFGETNARERTGIWAHCWADSEDELNAFAERAGLPVMWITKRKGKLGFYFYYVTPGMQKVCLRLGAVLTTIAQWKGEIK